MPDREKLLLVLKYMPDEAFDWIVLSMQPPVRPFDGRARIFPDGIGGFMRESQDSIIRMQVAAKEYLES